MKIKAIIEAECIWEVNKMTYCTFKASQICADIVDITYECSVCNYVTDKKEHINRHINKNKCVEYNPDGQNKNEIPYATVINENTMNTVNHTTDTAVRRNHTTDNTINNIIDPIGSNISLALLGFLL